MSEHQAIACRCGKCGLLSKQPIPDELKISVLGPRLSAAVSFVSSRVHGSRRAVEELLEEVLGAPLALGTMWGVCLVAYKEAPDSGILLPILNYNGG